jgi:hypothetical protein
MIETLPIDSIDSRIAALSIIAAVVAATGIYGTRRRLGPNADWVEVVRATCLPVLDPFVERAIGGVGVAYELSEAEHVGHIPAPPEDVEKQLWEAGCRRNVVSAFKTLEDDGREQVGAWVYRGDEIPADKQIDVMLFRTPDNETDVYAHEEFSSDLGLLFKNPRVLKKHYQGVEYNPKAGAEWVRSTFKSVEP